MKRILSVLFTLLMISVLPFSSFAYEVISEDYESEHSSSEDVTNGLSDSPLENLPPWNQFSHVSLTFFISPNNIATIDFNAVANDSSDIRATVYIERLFLGFRQRIDIGNSADEILFYAKGKYISGTETVKIAEDGKYRAVIVVENSYGTGSCFAEFDFKKNSSFADVNNDGFVTANDARLALRASAALDRLDSASQSRADVDLSGSITAADARIILRISAKLM